MLTVPQAGSHQRGCVVVRSVPWSGVAPILVFAVAPSVITAARAGHSFDGAVLAWWLIAASTVAFAFDEPARTVLDASATPLLRRVGVRLALVVSAAVASGFAVVGIVAALDGSGLERLRSDAAAIAAVASLSAAAAAVARRAGAARVSLGEVSVGPLVVLATSALSQRFAWLPSIVGDRHASRWWVAAAVGTVVAAWSTRDPYRR